MNTKPLVVMKNILTKTKFHNELPAKTLQN